MIGTPKSSESTARRGGAPDRKRIYDLSVARDWRSPLWAPIIDAMTLDVEAVRALYETNSLGGPNQAVGFVLWRVMHRYQRAADRALAAHDLTHLQFTTLAMVGWICRSGEGPVQAELAREADIHPMQISLMLKALEGKGMILRPRSVTDTRTRQVEITDAGLQALKAAFPVVIALQQAMFGEAGAPDGQFLAALSKIERGEP